MECMCGFVFPERPSEPVNFSVTSEGDTSLKLSWSKPDGKIDYYSVGISLHLLYKAHYSHIRSYTMSSIMCGGSFVLHACRFTTAMVRQP